MKTGPQVLCLGEVLWDYLADQPGQSFSEVTSWTPYPGGAPANVACRLAQLGTTVGFIGCVGQDDRGEALLAQLQQHQVNLTGVQRDAQAPTRQVYVTRSEQHDRNFAGFGHHSTTDFADTHLQGQVLPESLFATADFLVLGTLGLAYPETCEAIVQALRLAQKHDVKVWLDVNWRPMFWPQPKLARPMILDILPQVQILKLTAEEAQWLLGTVEPAQILQQFPQVGVLVTAGCHGCTYQIADYTGQVEAFPVSVVDTTGAGDAFLAGLLHQYCQGENLRDAPSLREMIRYASAVGALSTTHAGAISSQPGDVEIFLNAHR